MFKNEKSTYWLTHHAETVQALADSTNQSIHRVARGLALIAGDHADMPDADVVETFNGDHGLS